MAIFSLMAYINTDQIQVLFSYTSLALVALANIFRALLRSSINTNVGKFPAKYSGVLVNGVSFAGVITVTTSIVIISIKSVHFGTVGIYAFLFMTGITMSTLILYIFMSRTQFYKFYTEGNNNISNKIIDSNTKSIDDVAKVAAQHKFKFADFVSVLNSSKYFNLIGAITQISTFSMFPGFASLVEPRQWDSIYFVLVACFLIHQGCYFLGTQTAVILRWPNYVESPRKCLGFLGIVASFRLLILPFLFLSNVAPQSRRFTDVLVMSDWLFMALNALFSFTYGYIINMVFMYSPKTSAKPEMQAQTANLILASMSIMLLVGCLISNAFLQCL